MAWTNSACTIPLRCRDTKETKTFQDVRLALLPNQTPKVLGMLDSDHTPMARRRELKVRYAAPRKPKVPPKTEEHPKKPPGSHPRDTAGTSAAVPQEEVFSSCTQGLRRRPKAMRPAEDPVW